MANMCLDAHAAAINAVISPNHPSLLCFSRLIDDLKELYSAELDLGGYSGQDPAIDPWIRDAEMAFIRTVRSVDNVLNCEVDEWKLAEPLFEIAKIFQTILYSDDPAEVSEFRRKLRSSKRHFSGDLLVYLKAATVLKLFSCILDLHADTVEAPEPGL